MVIRRLVFDQVMDKICGSNKVVVILGPRQVGKTTLVKELMSQIGKKSLFLSGDRIEVRQRLQDYSLAGLRGLFGGCELVIIDEAQYVKDIGVIAKLVYDYQIVPNLILTGSSSFDLANKTFEPLTGRSWNFYLYPVSVVELKEYYDRLELETMLDKWLVYGLYPEVVIAENDKERYEILRELVNQYLYKDIFLLGDIRRMDKIHDLLKLLAYQVGSEVSYAELSSSLGIRVETVERYIQMLEKAFVIFKVGGFSRNLRKEVSKLRKIYFYDVGVRNAVIGDFNPINVRGDMGRLWENFVIAERLKVLQYARVPFGMYFWRLWSGAEIDYVEERGGKVYAFEVKYKKDKAKQIRKWSETYGGRIKVINKKNFLDWLGEVK